MVLNCSQKIDLNNGYHQLVLHEESRYITTFTTHVGLRRYKRLMFGIKRSVGNIPECHISEFTWFEWSNEY